MELTFKLLKAAQATALLLRERPGRRMSYLRLLKLLYLSDRAMFAEKLRTITGDQPVAMKKGPVLRRLYHLMKEEAQGAEAAEWTRYFHRDGHEVVMDSDPGTSTLSRLEKTRLLALRGKFHQTDDWELVELTHLLPEWRAAYAADAPEPVPDPVGECPAGGRKGEPHRGGRAGRADPASLRRRLWKGVSRAGG